MCRRLVSGVLLLALPALACARFEAEGTLLGLTQLTRAAASPATGGSDGGRVADTSLLLLYNFNEGAGATVNDTSANGAALDLAIDLPAGVSWVTGGLQILNNGNDVQIKSGAAATKVFTALQGSDSMTLEVWVKSANTTQAGPKRMFSFSQDTSLRNFTFGQEAQRWIVRRRLHINTDNNGVPSFETANIVTTAKTHVVYTRTSAGVEVIFVNGVPSTNQTLAGNFGTWANTHPFIVANENGGGRLWEGTLYLAAVYSRALSASEVATNYAAGSE